MAFDFHPGRLNDLVGGDALPARCVPRIVDVLPGEHVLPSPGSPKVCFLVELRCPLGSTKSGILLH